MKTIRSIKLLSLALCLVFAITPVLAQKRVALVIGNARYQHESTLRNPLNDAQLLQRTLKDKPLRFDEVLPLNNGTRGQMLQQLARFGKLAQGADVALLYYSGHGMINSKRQNYVLPVDMPKISSNADLDTDAALKSYGISETELIEAVEGAKVQVVVLDACRDNGFGEQKSGTRGLVRRPDQSKNRLIAYATEEGHTAEDGKGQNSTYAQSLAKHLVRTDLPLLTVFDEVANDVERQTANKQSPTRSGNLRTSVYLLASLVPVPAAPPPELAQSERQASPSAGQSLKDCAQCPELVMIPSGSFTMGSSAAEQAVANAGGVEKKSTDRESPQHSVSIKNFAAGKYAVTKGEFSKFVNAKSYVTEAEKGDGCYVWKDSKWQFDTASNWRNVGFKQEDDHPVMCVSWNDAKAYAQWISQISGKTYRLLSEAEREYAARAGSQSAFWWGDSISTAQANYAGTGSSYNNSAKGEYRQATMAVNSFKPNPFGLYNMHGNLWEWVQDCFHDNYSGAPTDGSAWTTGCSGDYRVLRGGSWVNNPASLRSAFRIRRAPDIRSGDFGFRLARTAP